MAKNNNGKKQKNENIGKKVVTIICVVILAALLILWGVTAFVNSGALDSRTIVMSSDNYEISNSTMTYLFNYQYQGMVSQYGSYLSSFGLDTKTDLRDQTAMGSTQSWYEYFMDAAKTSAKQTLVLCEAAKKAGIELDENDKAEIKAQIDSIKDVAENSGVSASTYLARVYGSRTNLKDLKKYITMTTLASKYATQISEGYEVAEADYNKEFEDNKETYQFVDYLKYSFNASSADDGSVNAEDAAAKKALAEELKAKTTREEFEEWVRNYTTEQKKAEVVDEADLDEEAIKSEADAAVTGLLNEAVTKTNAGEAGEWAFEDGRKAGDVNLVADDEAGTYSVYFMVTPCYRNEYATKNAAIITLAKSSDADMDDEAKKAEVAERVEAVLAEWEAGEKTEEAFLALTEKYSDAGAMTKVVENIDKSQEYSDWLYDEARVAGEVGTVEVEDGTYVIFFAGDGMVKWQADADTAIRNAKWDTDYAALESEFTVNEAEDIFVIPVDLSNYASSAATTAE